MTAQQIISEWNGKTQEQQENYCKAAVATALNDRYHLSPGYTFEDASQETFLRVLEAMQDPEALDADSKERTAAGKASNTLSAVVHRAARAGLARMAYQSRKHGKASASDLHLAHRAPLSVFRCGGVWGLSGAGRSAAAFAAFWSASRTEDFACAPRLAICSITF